MQFTAWVVVNAPRVATELLPLDQVAELVKFCDDPSLYVPVAVNATAAPAVCVGALGVTATETSDGGAGLCTAGPLTPCNIHPPVEADCPHAVEAITKITKSFMSVITKA